MYKNKINSNSIIGTVSPLNFSYLVRNNKNIIKNVIMRMDHLIVELTDKEQNVGQVRIEDKNRRYLEKVYKYLLLNIGKTIDSLEDF